MSTEPVLQLQNVTKIIGKRKIIDDLTFEVPRGEIFGLLGPNGAGKTTTIRMIVGLMSITSGRIKIEGKDVKRKFEQAMLHVGAIVENPEMYKFLTGYQNLVHFARMIPGITKERIDEVVELVGLQNRIHDKVKSYSLGMRQRLGVAQAILHRPSILILDEPTNGLDPAGIRELRDYLRKLVRTENISVLVSSHLLSEMELMCDRVAIIQNGKLIDVRLIRDMIRSQDDQKLKVLFETDRNEEAAQSMRAWAEDGGAEWTEDGVVVLLEREQIPDIVIKLTATGFRIYGVRTLTDTLEDKFLEITRGGQIV